LWLKKCIFNDAMVLLRSQQIRGIPGGDKKKCLYLLACESKRHSKAALWR